MKLIIFTSLYLFCCTLVCTQSAYVPEEENANGITYLLVETANGTYEIEDLTKVEVEVRVSASDVVYYFYSKSNTGGTAVSDISSVPSGTFDSSKQTMVLIHGWRNDYTSSFNTDIKSAVLNSHDINIIVVDWSSISKRSYLTAKNSVPDIGKLVGTFIQSLSSTYNIALSNIMIVGHSLGAHVSGVAGSTLQGGVSYIVGLDPAGPLISVSDKSYCLDTSDAQYVEVVHTNGGTLGIQASLGHADYFPNGGSKQPGCGIDATGSCSHGRAYEFYAESIGSNNFVSKSCSSYSDYSKGSCSGGTALMGGYDLAKGASGNYYLNTGSSSPYGLGG